MLQAGDIRATVEHGRGIDAVFQKIVNLRRTLQNIIRKREQLAVFAGADADSLLNGGTMADCGEHQLARHRDLDWPLHPRAPIAAIQECGQGKSLDPKPDPINGEKIWIDSGGMPNTWEATL